MINDEIFSLFIPKLQYDLLLQFLSSYFWVEFQIIQNSGRLWILPLIFGLTFNEDENNQGELFLEFDDDTCSI